MTAYTYLAADLLTGEIRDEVPLAECAFSHVLGGAGGFEGKLPLEVRVPVLVSAGERAVQVLELPGTAGAYASTPDQAALDVTGDLEVIVTVPTGFDWTPAATAGLVCKFADGPGGWSWLLLLHAAGNVQLYTSPDNSTLVSGTSSVAVPAGTRRLRARRVASTGAVTFATTAGDDTNWSALGAPQATTAGGIYAGSAPIVIGSDRAAGTTAMLDGQIQRVEVRNGLDGTIVASPAFDAQAPGTTSFRDDQGNTWTVQGAGSIVNFSAEVPAVWTSYNRVTRSVLDPGRTLLHVLRNGSPVWSGILWSVEAAVESDSLSLAGQGVWSYFLRRLLEATKTYSAADQFTIVSDLIAYAQAQAGGNLGLVVAWDALSGVLRDRTYHGYERKNIGEAIKQLSEVDNGFDFAVDVTGSVSAGFTYTLNLSHPYRGRRTNLVFETKKNVRVMSWGLDAYTMVNRQSAVGAGEGDSMLLATAADPGALSAYPLLQASSSHKDVSVFDTLADHARSELRAALLGTETLSVEVLPTEVDAALGSFITGDEIKVRGGKGYLQLDAFYRVTSYGVKVDSSGRETLQATLSRSTETIA